MASREELFVGVVELPFDVATGLLREALSFH
jgi:hypothetical protein